MKTCRICFKTEKEVSFYLGRRLCCKCRCEQQTAYYNKNKLSIKKKRVIADATPSYIAKRKVYIAKWQKDNPEKCNAIHAKRHAAKLNRIPKWLTKADWIEIKWAYKIARQLTKETEIKHVVDHIIPLQGKNISGLHCPQNLQIITKQENSTKSNKFPY